jgi:hypothetical protein
MLAISLPTNSLVPILAENRLDWNGGEFTAYILKEERSCLLVYT